MSIKKRFEKFLKDEGVYEEFCNTLDMYHDGETFDQFASYVRNQSSYLTKAFAWDNAISGYKVWSQLHIKWQQINNLPIHKEFSNG